MGVPTLRASARLALAALVASYTATVAAESPKGSTGNTAQSAAGIGETMVQWGLLGTWSSDCAGRPSQAVPFYTWVQRGRDAFLDRDYGYGKDSNRILAASVLPDGAIELRIEFKAFSQTRVNTYIKGDDGRIRMFVNHDMHGGYSVKDGKLVDNSAATHWDTRCR